MLSRVHWLQNGDYPVRVTANVPVDEETYRRVRESPRWFILLPDHVDSALETVVETHPGYVIVEKTGAAGDVAEQTS